MKILTKRNLFPDQRVARYNLTAWQKTDSDSMFFIGREVIEAGTFGEPDAGILKLFEVSSEGSIVAERIIWKPIFEGINLEDPRALELPSENLTIGLTAVLRNKKGQPVPFPAIIKIDSHNTWTDELPPFLIISTFGAGKNLTPLDYLTYLFRPEIKDYNHKILVFSMHHQFPKKICDIEFPTNLPWAKWRIGTTMPPIWINEHEALFIFHGISTMIVNGKPTYVYSLGRAKLTRYEDKIDIKVATDPIITPDDFLDATGLPLVKELHPDIRRVVYSCGGVIKKGKTDIFSLYVNVGDRTTFEVEFSLKELKEGLF